MLLEAGAETVQVTCVVDSVMGLGVTETVAPLMLKVLSVLFATVLASAVDPPGTMTIRQASYAALSTACCRIAARANSMEAQKNSITNGRHSANSTTVVPKRFSLNLKCVNDICGLFSQQSGEGSGDVAKHYFELGCGRGVIVSPIPNCSHLLHASLICFIREGNGEDHDSSISRCLG